MRPITARVAARLREERQRQGVSLEALASAARVSPNAIIRFETGKTSIQLDTLTRLVVRGLGLDWASFMASTSPAVAAAVLPLDPKVALSLSRAEAAQVRRWLTAVARTLRRARRRADADDRSDSLKVR
jgi:transcriptional regulator with XRE-family HTH domain